MGHGRNAENKAVCQALIAHTRSEVEKLDLPVFWMDEQQQRGKNFGERLHNAAGDVFARGYERLLIIGNDSPQLTVAKMQSAAKALAKETFVLGPARDGGVYLLGFNRKQFQQVDLIHLPWRQAHLFETLQNTTGAFGFALEVLDTLSDIDHKSDLFAFLRKSKKLWSKALQRRLSKLQGVPFLGKASFAEDPEYRGPAPLRGPPHILQA